MPSSSSALNAEQIRRKKRKVVVVRRKLLEKVRGRDDNEFG